MDASEHRRPWISRLRRAVLGERAGVVSSAVRNIDGIATYGHRDLDADLVGDRDPTEDDRKS